MNQVLERFSWLFIGLGMGITLGKDNLVLLIFGVGLTTLCFVLNFINEKMEKAEDNGTK